MSFTRLHSQSHVTPLVSFCHYAWPPFQVQCYRPCRRGDIKSLIWHVISWNHVIRIVWLHYGLDLTIRLDPAKIGGHVSSRGRNILFLVCHVISCDQVVRGISNFMGAFTSSWVTSLLSFMPIGIVKEDMLHF